jgi:hypothetical protein
MSSHHRTFVEITIPPASLNTNVQRRRKGWFARMFECRMPKDGYVPSSWFDIMAVVITVVLGVIGLGMAWMASR